MKRKLVALLIPALLSMSLLTSCDGGGHKLPGLPEGYGEGYYKDFNFDLRAGRMLYQIHNHMFEKHTKWTTYNSLEGYYNYTTTRDSIDAPESGTNKICYFYTGKITENRKYAGNREHVWPCANSAGLWTHNAGDENEVVETYVGGGSDLYHVRPANDAVNEARGNSKFVDADDFPNLTFEEVGEKNGEYKVLLAGLKSGSYASKCEVADELKGDLARIIAYVYVHYSAIGELEGKYAKYNKYCGGLNLTQVLDYPEDKCMEKLCEWNRLDPPDEMEKLRNKTVQKIQGNRNVFVDYPKLMERMFGLDD